LRRNSQHRNLFIYLFEEKSTQMSEKFLSRSETKYITKDSCFLTSARGLPPLYFIINFSSLSWVTFIFSFALGVLSPLQQEKDKKFCQALTSSGWNLNPKPCQDQKNIMMERKKEAGNSFSENGNGEF
jgi:hypothetical protein